MKWCVWVAVLVACGGDDRPTADGSIEGDAATDTAIDTATDTPRTDSAIDVPGPVCETVSARAEPLPATLLFQIDTSNSMNCAFGDVGCLTDDPTPDPNDSRWDVLTRELSTALGTAPGGNRVGAMRFPRTGGACANNELLTPIAPLETNLDTLRTSIGAIVPDGLSTPTHDAVAFGLSQLSGQERPYLVLATDGDARVCFGCDTDCAFDDPSALDRDNDDLVARVQGAAESGVPTFVVGVPGSQVYRQVLSRIATAGGTAREGCSDIGPTFCHFDLSEPGIDFAGELAAALAEIGEAVIACEYDIPDNPDGAFDATRVNVRITTDGTEETIGRDETRSAGWDYTDDMSRIELHGTACEAARAADQLDILFGCPTILI